MNLPISAISESITRNSPRYVPVCKNTREPWWLFEEHEESVGLPQRPLTPLDDVLKLALVELALFPLLSSAKSSAPYNPIIHLQKLLHKSFFWNVFFTWTVLKKFKLRPRNFKSWYPGRTCSPRYNWRNDSFQGLARSDSSTLTNSNLHGSKLNNGKSYS